MFERRALRLAALTAATLLTAQAEAAKYPTPNPKQSAFAERLETTATGASAPASSAGAEAIVTGPATTFYFSAHPDDVTLFMNPMWDVPQQNVKVVFIFTTAGDAGMGTGPSTPAYFLARENGSKRAVRFLADVNNYAEVDPVDASVTVRGHVLRRFEYKNTVAYFLRLPDGNGDGGGFPGTGSVSLTKLRAGRIASLTAIDRSTVYRGWNDLMATITTIVRSEAAGSSNVWLNAPDFNTSVNVDDHADHVATGAAIAMTRWTLPCVNTALYTGYSLANIVNLKPNEIEDKSAVFGAYAGGMADMRRYGIWDIAHKAVLAAMRFRILRGTGACAF